MGAQHRSANVSGRWNSEAMRFGTHEAACAGAENRVLVRRVGVTRTVSARSGTRCEIEHGGVWVTVSRGRRVVWCLGSMRWKSQGGGFAWKGNVHQV
jgi:hypothetical protein